MPAGSDRPAIRRRAREGRTHRLPARRGKASAVTMPSRPEPYRFVDRALFWLEAVTLAVLLLVTVVWPRMGLLGIPTWGIVLLVAGYGLLADLAQNWAGSLRALRWRSVADLPMTALAYLLAGEPGGPLFVLFVLAVNCAAAVMTPRGILLYAAAAVAAVAAVDLALLPGAPGAAALPDLAARPVVLALAGVGMAVVMRPLLLEREAARSARDETERLVELDRLRAGFVAAVSHDLRTPLTAARAGLGMLELGAAGALPPDELQLLGDARRNLDRLGRLIDDLLAANRLEAGAMPLGREPLDLRAVATGAAAAVQPLIREKGQALAVDLPGPLPVAGDPRQLEQAVVNLLENAHRHTPAGTRIAIGGRVGADGVVLSVGDDGPGIPAGELEAVFEHGRRLAGPGSGLGLAIARGIVELHGGRVWAESGLGTGTTVSIVLPRHGDGEGP